MWQYPCRVLMWGRENNEQGNVQSQMRRDLGTSYHLINVDRVQKPPTCHIAEKDRNQRFRKRVMDVKECVI